jgi:hypothetical protein
MKMQMLIFCGIAEESKKLSLGVKLELALESKQKANGELLKKIKHHADSSTELS